MPQFSIRKTRLAIIALTMMIFQVSIINRFALDWGKPDLLCLLGAFLVLYGPIPDLMWGLLAIGLLRDFGSGGQFGMSALAMLPAGAVTLCFRDRFYRGGSMDVVLCFLFMVVFSFVEGTGILVFEDAPSAIMIARVGLGQSLFTVALSFPFFYLAEHMHVVEAGDQPLFAN